MRVIGIDPGQDGAYAIVEGTKLIEAKTFPMTLGHKKIKEIDFKTFSQRLQFASRQADLILIEEVHAIPRSSARATFNFGKNFQMAVCAANLCITPSELVAPRKWQAPIYNEGIPLFKTINGKNRRDTKGMAALAAKRLFPDESFLKTKKSRVPHDGMIDAALIAYWGANIKGKKIWRGQDVRKSI